MIKDENYIQVAGWMLNELRLKGNELLIYALIHGFSQDGRSTYHGGLSYIAEWTNSTKQGVIKCLKSLLDKKLIMKIPVRTPDRTQYCAYVTTKSREKAAPEFTATSTIQNDSGKQSLPAEGSTKFTTIQNDSVKLSLPDRSSEFNGGGKQSLPNKNSEILRNSTSPENNEIQAQKAAEAEALISQELKNLFGGHLVFDPGFVPEIARLLAQFGISGGGIGKYLSFVFERTSDKKPNSITNMYYKMAKSAAIVQDFVLKESQEAARDRQNTATCPVCGGKAKLNEPCPGCGFDMLMSGDEKEIALHRQILALSEEDRRKFREEYHREIERQSSLGWDEAIRNPALREEFSSRISAICRKYGITA